MLICMCDGKITILMTMAGLEPLWAWAIFGFKYRGTFVFLKGTRWNCTQTFWRGSGETAFLFPGTRWNFTNFSLGPDETALFKILLLSENHCKHHENFQELFSRMQFHLAPKAMVNAVSPVPLLYIWVWIRYIFFRTEFQKVWNLDFWKLFSESRTNKIIMMKLILFYPLSNDVEMRIWT